MLSLEFDKLTETPQISVVGFVSFKNIKNNFRELSIEMKISRNVSLDLTMLFHPHNFIVFSFDNHFIILEGMIYRQLIRNDASNDFSKSCVCFMSLIIQFIFFSKAHQRVKQFSLEALKIKILQKNGNVFITALP